MGFTCKIFGHKWNGCKCVKCSETRDEGHKWEGCKCEICGKYSEERHIWNEINSCCKICTVCGNTTIRHKWKGKEKQKMCETCGIKGYQMPYGTENLVLQAIVVFGNDAFEFPYVYHSLVKKIQQKGIVLDAHEIAGIHGLLLGFHVALSQKASPIAGGLMLGKTPDEKSIMDMDRAFKLREEVVNNIRVLQRIVGEKDNDVISFNTPEMKKKLGMYL